MVSKERKIHHLLWRGGFGPGMVNYENHSVQDVLKGLFQDAKTFEPIAPGDNSFEEMKRGKDMSQEEKKALKKASRVKIIGLNNSWIEKMCVDSNALRERMTFFWHNHFPSTVIFAFLVKNQNNTLRQHALGSFRDLLFAVSKDPAMLQYLNNQQNKKSSPNENFAREVMELFTLGRGNYTEDDIKNAARAFTGWGFNLTGDFVFRENVHDEGSKTFFGKSGYYTGDDILNMILDNSQTARFMARKICHHFVGENVPNDIVLSLAKSFYESNYDITALMKNIFSSDWFYSEQNIGTRIKSPVDLLVGIVKTYDVKTTNPLAYIYVQKCLGQILFFPPNVAGWPGGRTWIDSSSLLFRMKLSDYIFDVAQIDTAAKDDLSTPGEETTMMAQNQDGTRIKKMDATVNWKDVESRLQGIGNDKVAATLMNQLLQSELHIKDEELKKITDDSSRENYIHSLCRIFTVSPEYQLC